GELARLQPVEQRGALGVGGTPGLEGGLPLGPGGRSAVADLAHVGDDLVGHLEVLLGVEAEDLLQGADLLGAERGAVDRAGVLLGGEGQPMIVRSAMIVGRPVSASPARIAASSASTSSS